MAPTHDERPASAMECPEKKRTRKWFDREVGFRLASVEGRSSSDADEGSKMCGFIVSRKEEAEEGKGADACSAFCRLLTIGGGGSVPEESAGTVGGGRDGDGTTDMVVKSEGR